MTLVVVNLPAKAGDKETCIWCLSLEDVLEEGMAAHSCMLAWKIPWAEEPGRLYSRVSYESDVTEAT